jgi:hypothetical protein
LYIHNFSVFISACPRAIREKSQVTGRKLRLKFVHAAVILILFVIVGCSPPALSSPEIEAGSSKGEVIALLGDPDQTQEFVLPDEPFFGPQESLVNLVPAGTVIEEWVYELGEDVLYIWFTGEGDNSGEDWLVLDTAKYPKDAVY